MTTEELTSREAVLHAIEEFDQRGRDPRVEKRGMEEGVRYYLQHHGQLYDAEVIAGAAYGHQHPTNGRLSPAEVSAGQRISSVSALLRNLDFIVLDRSVTTTSDELAWRLALWGNLQARCDQKGELSAFDLRAVGAYGGGRGIWVNKARTQHIHRGTGVAVALNHTGVDYPDDVSENGMLYRYPDTQNSGHDLADVNAAKAAARLKLPVFAISKHGSRRSVRLAWIDGWNDTDKIFLVRYGDTAAQVLLDMDRSDEEPFVLEGNRSRLQMRNVRVRPDQTRFKFQVIQRYGARCPLSGVEVTAMLEAVHLRGDADNGTSDPRNGLPMNAALHRAFDLHLFAINPDTLEVELRPNGPTLQQMGIISPRLNGLPKLPHREALAWRYHDWQADVAKNG